MKISFIFILCCCWLSQYYGQTGELDHFDCNYCKGITIPFNYSETNAAIKPKLNQAVFYSFRDQFTYWYKVTAKSDGKLNIKITAINDSDSYVVYMYQYNETDFCNKLYQKKLKPIMPSILIDNANKQGDNTVKELDIKKDNIYYISVLNISLNNCGHHLFLNYGPDTLKIQAFHVPCKKDITSLPVTQKISKPIIVTKDTVIMGSDVITAFSETITTNNPVITPIANDAVKIAEPVFETKTINRKIECLVKDKKKLTLMNSNFMFIDTDTKNYLEPTNIGIGKWELILEKDKTYKIKCTALGYNDLEMNLDVNTKNPVELFLEPLKAGDNFIMRSIYFHPNTYALRRESTEELQKLLHYLIDNPSVTIEIQGHTNGDNKIYKNKAYINLGEEWNFQGSSKNLSLKRAEAIKNFLITNGVSAERLLAAGHGGKKPIIKDPETMEEGQKNIRVEVVILKD